MFYKKERQTELGNRVVREDTEIREDTLDWATVGRGRKKGSIEAFKEFYKRTADETW